MTRHIIFLSIFFNLLSTVVFSQKLKITEPEIKQIFQDFKTNGTFVLYDLKNDSYHFYDKERANQGFLPASTYKIMNSLVALETGAIKDTNEIIKWDGVKRDFPSWNMDHNMKSAIKASSVPFYQEVARRIGEKRMQEWVDKANYGNKNISGGIDMFWLTGGLRISAIQEVEFLKKLFKEELPFSEKNMKIVKDILIIEKTDSYILRGKTGWQPPIGWWVGYLEKKDNVYFIALNMDMKGFEEAPKRIEITKAILRKAGVY